MQHFVFQRHAVVAFFDDVILMENVAHKMAVIQFMDDFIVDFRRQFFKPVAVVAAQSDVERDQVLHFIVVHGAIADGGGGDGETMQHRGLGFFGVTFEKRAAVVGKILFQERARFIYAFPAHFQNQVVFVFVAVIAHGFGQVVGQEFADELHCLVGKMFGQEADFFAESVHARLQVK